MRTFEEILDLAAARKGSREAVLAEIETPKTDKDLAAIPDDRWLASMARSIFQAGISWTVVENKWPGTEEAFFGFDVDRVAGMSEDWYDDLLADTRIVRSPPKVSAIQHNAEFIQKVSREAGSFGRKVADWPAEDFAGLLEWLKTEGDRLGGATGSHVMRSMGKDSFVLSDSVVARLEEEGVIDKPPTSKKAMAAVQAAFNTWREQSGEPLTTISRVLAQSIDA
jgi:3-methyladenine DNA glycosylase Tag